MIPLTQSKLLHALQERKVRPVGSAVEAPIDIRLIVMTNREPEGAVRSGQLCADLYYHLQANLTHLPPLRERRDDIRLLVDHFIDLFNEKLKRPVPVTGIAEDALAAMVRYDWPGNVRELSDAIEGAFTISHGSIISLPDLPATITGDCFQKPTGDGFHAAQAGGTLPRSDVRHPVKTEPIEPGSRIV